MSLKWQFGTDDMSIVADHRDGLYVVTEADRSEGIWRAVFIDDERRTIKTGPLGQCLGACAIDAYEGKVPGPPDPPRPAKWNEVA